MEKKVFYHSRELAVGVWGLGKMENESHTYLNTYAVWRVPAGGVGVIILGEDCPCKLRTNANTFLCLIQSPLLKLIPSNKNWNSSIKTFKFLTLSLRNFLSSYSYQEIFACAILLCLFHKKSKVICRCFLKND